MKCYSLLFAFGIYRLSKSSTKVWHFPVFEQDRITDQDGFTTDASHKPECGIFVHVHRCIWHLVCLLSVAQIPISFSLAARRSPSTIISILSWNVGYRRILHGGYNVLLEENRSKSCKLWSCFSVFTICILSGCLLDIKSTTYWPLQGPGADAVWEDRRDIRLLEIHAGTLTFSTGSPHLDIWTWRWGLRWIHARNCRLACSYQEQTSLWTIAVQSFLTFSIQLRQRPPHEVLLLVVGSSSFPLLLQQILLSPTLRVVFPQSWSLQLTEHTFRMIHFT